VRYFYKPFIEGYTVEKIKSSIEERDVYIWGGSFLERCRKRRFERNGLLIKASCDSDSKLRATNVDNIEVISPYKIFDNITNKNNALLIIASMKYRKESSDFVNILLYSGSP